MLLKGFFLDQNWHQTTSTTTSSRQSTNASEQSYAKRRKLPPSLSFDNFFTFLPKQHLLHISLSLSLKKQRTRFISLSPSLSLSRMPYIVNPTILFILPSNSLSLLHTLLLSLSLSLSLSFCLSQCDAFQLFPPSLSLHTEKQHLRQDSFHYYLPRQVRTHPLWHTQATDRRGIGRQVRSYTYIYWEGHMASVSSCIFPLQKIRRIHSRVLCQVLFYLFLSRFNHSAKMNRFLVSFNFFSFTFCLIIVYITPQWLLLGSPALCLIFFVGSFKLSLTCTLVALLFFPTQHNSFDNYLKRS